MPSPSLSELSHEELSKLREKSDLQALLAPFEHQAFAREWTRENPLNALSLLPAIPGYQLYKLLGLDKEATPPSLDQLFGGYRGLIEGLR